MHERRESKHTPDNIVLKLIGDENNLNRLNDGKRNIFHFKITHDLDKLSPDELTLLTDILLSGIASKDDTWTRKRREGGVHLLQMIPFEKKHINHDTIANIYLKHIKNQKKSLDPNGGIHYLVQAGNILAPHLPSSPEIRSEISGALDETIGKLQDVKDKDAAIAQIEELRKKIENPDAFRVPDKEMDHGRNGVQKFVISSENLFRRNNNANRDNKPTIQENENHENHAASVISINKRRPEKIWDPNTSDKELVDAAKHGDKGAFSLLVERNYIYMFTLACRITQNEDDAKDVTQKAFLKAYRGIRRFEGDSSFSTWMFRIVTNASITHKSVDKKHNHEELNDEVYAEETKKYASPELMGERESERKIVSKALSELSETHRVVLVLHDIYDLPHGAIADTLGISETASKVRVLRARRALKERLLNSGVMDLDRTDSKNHEW